MSMTPLEREVACLREEVTVLKTAFRAWAAMLATAVDHVPLADVPPEAWRQVAEMEREGTGHPIIHPINGCGLEGPPAPPGPPDPPD